MDCTERSYSTRYNPNCMWTADQVSEKTTTWEVGTPDPGQFKHCVMWHLIASRKLNNKHPIRRDMHIWTVQHQQSTVTSKLH